MPTKQAALPENIAYRQLSLRPQTEADKAAGAIPVILATEAPVKTYDKVHRKVVNEILLMSGAELPKQVPMKDDHEGGSKNAVGSLRALAIAADELHAYAHFSSKRSAQEMKQDVLDGHLTDMSVGAERLEETFIDTGKEATVAGRRFSGPSRIVTRWRPIHGAVVDSGADSRSIFTPRAYSDPEQLLEDDMNATIREHYVSLGMPKEHTDEQAGIWAKENIVRKAEPAAKVEVVAGAPDDETIKRAREEATKAETLRVKEIRNSVRGAQLEDAFADKLIDDGVTRADSAQRILDELSKRHKAHGRGADIVAVGSERESFRKAVMDGFSLRMGWTPSATEKPSPGANEFRHVRFTDLARKCLEQEGITVRGMDDRDVLGRAFAVNHTMRASDGQAYLVSGNFSNLLLDAQNKQLLKSFDEYPTTYQLWAGQRPSVPDFKNINVIRLGEVGNQPTVEENGDYKDMSLSDSKETYRVEKRGSLISLTYEAMRNDDLGGFSRLVTLQGSAMKRTINASIYQVLFDNAALSDTGLLFNSTALTTAGGHANTTTGAISVSAINAAWSAMMLQTGLNSDVILGITPKWLIVPPGISGTAYQLIASTADPAAGGSAVGNSGNANIYGPGGARGLQIIVEPILNGNDVDAWYLAASSNLIDTVQYCFLQGEENPVFEQETAFIQDAVKYKIRQTWGRAAVDYRGLYRSTG